jgi:hypothetical protein
VAAPVVLHARQGQNRLFTSFVVLRLHARTRVATGEAPPYALLQLPRVGEVPLPSLRPFVTTMSPILPLYSI